MWCAGLPHSDPAPSLQRLTLLRAVQGLLLDLDAATLTVWVNGERKGVMVRPGMAVDSEDDSHGEPVARLDGPLRWAVEMASTSTRPWSVTIGGPLPPPT